MITAIAYDIYKKAVNLTNEYFTAMGPQILAEHDYRVTSEFESDVTEGGLVCLMGGNRDGILRKKKSKGKQQTRDKTTGKSEVTINSRGKKRRKRNGSSRKK